MRRLFQFGAILMLLGAVYPLLEFFDHWDSPGLSNDTEFKVYAILFALCLVTLLCKLIFPDAWKFATLSTRVLQDDEKVKPSESGHTFIFAVPPLPAVPLRI